eukprot:TRINITY_DN2384_c0_g3_i2.p1 TRINITY_DN2384_c0_g3~~TRINITY_DN2384_c0_g3_i2.p1  ORF type:complete len:120 (+),score=3.98 TRINITY_DN2384_c0_g3_i2:194-553(+)
MEHIKSTQYQNHKDDYHNDSRRPVIDHHVDTAKKPYIIIIIVVPPVMYVTGSQTNARQQNYDASPTSTPVETSSRIVLRAKLVIPLNKSQKEKNQQAQKHERKLMRPVLLTLLRACRIA